jgi:hypothetical protein
MSPHLGPRPLPAPAEHAGITVLNPLMDHYGIRTTILCSCEAVPPAPPTSSRTMHAWHDAHRAEHGLGPADPQADIVFGQGPWTGWTWDEWYARIGRHRNKGNTSVDPYTGQVRDWDAMSAANAVPAHPDLLP